jgi:hypothetical protein
MTGTVCLRDHPMVVRITETGLQKVGLAIGLRIVPKFLLWMDQVATRWLANQEFIRDCVMISSPILMELGRGIDPLSKGLVQSLLIVGP